MIFWMLVAHRTDARIFQSTGKDEKPQLLYTLRHPEGRKQNREIVSDAQGNYYGHSLDPHINAANHTADQFAKELALNLKEGRVKNNFDHLVIIAEPSFLGRLRGFLDKETCDKISMTINKNLTHLTEHELFPYLKDMLREIPKVA
jgi:protein required for attachment to host cells